MSTAPAGEQGSAASDQALLGAALQAPTREKINSSPSHRRRRSSLSTTPPHKVTLSDVLQEYPSEDHAETAVFAGTENEEPCPAVPNLLRHLPDGAEDAFANLEPLRQPQDPMVEPFLKTTTTAPLEGQHNRQPTMEERIDGLTDVLKAIHGPEDVNSVLTEPPAVDTMNLHSHLLKKRQSRRWSAKEVVVNCGSSAGTGGSGLPNDLGSAFSASLDIENVEAGLEGDNTDGKSPYLSIDWQRKHSKDTASTSRCTKCLSKVPVLSTFVAFLQEQGKNIRTYLNIVLFLMLPSVAVAAVLFYWGDNYPTGRVDKELSTSSFTINHKGKIMDPEEASLSWWILFIGCRQLVTLSIAQTLQFLLIDFLTIGRRWVRHWPAVTLLVVQSRGWPFLLTFWCALSLGFNYGNTSFAGHWLNHQSYVALFTDQNPSGGINTDETYFKILCLGIAVGLVVAAKRTWIGFFLAKKTYVTFAGELTSLMEQIIALSRIAKLARSIEEDYMEAENDSRVIHQSRAGALGHVHEEITALVNSASHNREHDSDLNETAVDEISESPFVIDPEQTNKLTGDLTDDQKLLVARLLGAWEEPDQAVKVEESNVSINAVLRFRQSLSLLDTPYVFSTHFGLVNSRQSCIERSQEVYMRLFLDSPKSTHLNFDVIATLARRNDGSFNTDFLKDLIALVRPGRDGTITLREFVKSVDTVYKQARLLSASVKNSLKIDVAFEFIFNFLFYVVLSSVVLSFLGFSPFQIFLSLSSVILAFAFMIGSASSKYFEGLLFILVQKPYAIGDRINIEPANAVGNAAGSASWIVKDVTLFTTTIVLSSTNEKATVSNGTLASSRIINAARSPNAIIMDSIKFGLDVPYTKIQTFQEALTQFVKARPREWLSLIALRASEVAVDQGFVKYSIILQHRSSWQDIAAVKQSHADVQSYWLELSKEMDMHFKTPVVPVNLSMVDTGAHPVSAGTQDPLTADSPTIQRVANLFELRN